MKINFANNAPINRPDFIFGVATSSYQIEGAHAADGRTPSIWDTFCDKSGTIADGSNGTIACDHYFRWFEDIDLIASLNVDAYRFSISWSRIIPDDTGKVNQAGIDFYMRIVDRLIELGIKPFVTLYHWDLPQYLEDKGGWLNRETATKFAEYADVISTHFGEKIQSYTTFNEPWCSTFLSYEFGIHAPGLKEKDKAFQAAHHILLAHGLAIPILKKKAPKSSHGIVLNFEPAYPNKDTEADKAAVQFSNDAYYHWFLKPLMDKSYPESAQKAFPNLMPKTEPGDMDIIATPIDFLGINYYTRRIVTTKDQENPSEYEMVKPETNNITSMGWEVYPNGLYELLMELNNKYNLPPIYITENGAAFDDEYKNKEIDDPKRIDYFQTHIDAVNRALEQKVDIRGYFAWSLMDNFEWAEGYKKRFGLVYVDYKSQKRILKNSGKAYRDFLGHRKKTK